MKKFYVVFYILISALIFSGCDSPVTSSAPLEDNSMGNLSIIIKEEVSRSILPEISMSPDYYLVEGSGPDTASFRERTNGVLNQSNLVPGEWTLSVTAYNSTDTAIGSGSAVASVISYSTTGVAITVNPYSGFGTLDLSLSWIDEQVFQPQVESTLTPVGGTARTLDFTINGAQAEFRASDIPAGYHTLTLKLRDHGFLNMSTVEIVRIAQDVTSSGHFLFDQINQATGFIEIPITPGMGDPLTLSMLGIKETKPQNHSMTLSAKLEDYEGAVNYQWYVNAEAVGTGESFTLNSSWEQGYYRVDLTAYSSDGSRAGSTYAYVEVVEPVAVPVDGFTSLWDMSLTDTNTLIFPLVEDGNYNFIIDWGDGTIESYTDSDVSHTYATEGIYTVSVNGLCEGFGFSQFGIENNEENLIDISQWADVKLHNGAYKFAECRYLTDFSATDMPDLSSITDISFMFYRAGSFNADISGWDISNITNMSYIFGDAQAFNQDISSWDTSNVTDMSAAFYGTNSFNQDISTWDTSKVTTMELMFGNALVFNQNISTWDTSAVSDMSFMFRNSSAFNQDLSAWDTSAVTDMSWMFERAAAFNGDISGWDTSAVTNMGWMFLEATVFNQPLSSWNTSNVLSMKQMFRKAASFNQDLSAWDTSSVSNMDNIFENASAFNGDISGWDTTGITSMKSMFRYASSFNQDLSSWDTSNVTDMSNMFVEASSFNGTLNGWDTSKVTDMSNMFEDCPSFNRPLSSWDTSSVTDMSYIFMNATSFNQDISTWDTSNVTDMIL